MAANGDTDRKTRIGTDDVVGVGSFHKTLPHNQYGEVCSTAFEKLVKATRGNGTGFSGVPQGSGDAAQLTNPQGGLAADQLTHHPSAYEMPPAPKFDSISTAAEMTELYWMSLLRDVPLNTFTNSESTQGLLVSEAADELQAYFEQAIADGSDPGRLMPGIDLPGSSAQLNPITPANIFRLGLPGEEVGPMISQFFVRPVAFGTQSIDQRQRPYKADLDFLTDFSDWLNVQKTGRDCDKLAYGQSNEASAMNFENEPRYISTMRDLARFVNKDALHQAYFNAALLLLSGKAKWTAGNPYGDFGILATREQGFGVLGGPHILALVSEVATRALKIVWNQKWQVHLRLRPEVYGGRAHVQFQGVNGTLRDYGLPGWVATTKAATRIKDKNNSLLLPLAFTAGSPTHPAYGAGHATVAGACVTILKAFFQTFETCNGEDRPIPFLSLKERVDPTTKEPLPHDPTYQIIAYETGACPKDSKALLGRRRLVGDVDKSLTIEGELNKLAQNVAMGRSMGGVHWRSDNSRSLILGEAIAAEILANITVDANERPSFEFRTFARKADGLPKKVQITAGRIFVDGMLVDTHGSSL